ncbi:MAG TPA: xanthine dehydrogenase family protein subunit M [Acidilobales archaeon]|nr:xanthine dehydrogenase family protein subunit M [Acidilobales archaeon]
MRASPINYFNTHIIPLDFEYFEPRTLKEVLDLLDKLRDKAAILAGGTDLLVQMKIRRKTPKYLINIKKIPDLTFIKVEEGGLRIGAATKLRSIEKSNVVRDTYVALYEAIKSMGSVQIRNMATIGGNLCNASPAADTAPPLLVYEAKLRIVSLRGERLVPINKFFKGPGRTVMEPNELLTEIIIPKPPKNSGASFIKIARTSMDLAKVNVAVLLKLKNSSRTIDDVKIALGAVAPTPMRAYAAEEYLRGKEFNEDTLRRAGEIASMEIKPITDIRSTAWYRREVTKIIVKDALERAFNMLRR